MSALKPRGLTPAQRRKVKAINDAVASVDRAVRDHLASIDTFDRTARKVNSGRVFPEWPQRLLGLQTETLKARDRLNRLQTGMRAEHNLAAALAELASAFGAWHRGLTATDEDVVTAAIAAMRRHHRNAARLGKSGLADLKAGR